MYRPPGSQNPTVLPMLVGLVLILGCGSEEREEGGPTSSGGAEALGGKGTGGAATGGLGTGGVSGTGGAATGGLGTGGVSGIGGGATGGLGTGGPSGIGGAATGGLGPGGASGIGGGATGGLGTGGVIGIGGAATGGMGGTGGGTTGGMGGTGGGTTGGASGTTGGASGTTGGASGTGGGAGSGCGQAAPASPPGSVDVDGVERTFIVDLPSNYDSSAPAPILFALHGMGGDGESMKSWANLGPVFGDSYILVYPDALPNAGGTTEWVSHEMQDVYFFDAMLERLSSTYCVDSSRVFVTGLSSGGYETNSIGCRRRNVVRAIAPQSGEGPLLTPCDGPIAAIIIHGKNDTNIDGDVSRDYWGEAAGCAMDSTTPAGFNPVCSVYSGCEAGAPLVYCLHDGGHELWSAAPQAMFDFFASL